MSTSNDLTAVEKRIADLEVVCGEANQEISKAALEVQQAWQGKGLHDITASIQNDGTVPRISYGYDLTFA